MKGRVLFLNRNELKEIISTCLNDVLFIYNGKMSGITSEVHDYIPIYQVWHGDETKEYSDIELLMTDRFYSGNAIEDLIEKVEFSFA